MQTHLSGKTVLDIPNSRQVEISLFGPGYGECVCVHVGNGEWMVVDSCRSPLTKRPACMEYLSKIGLQPSEVVTRILVSHCHDDHIDGLAEVVSACDDATVYYSNAICSKDFAGLSCQLRGSRQLDEIGCILTKSTGTKDRLKRLNPVMGNMRLVFDSIQSEGVSICREVWAVSPSSFSCTLSKAEWAQELTVANSGKNVRVKCNDTSIVLIIKIGSCVILLGSDLEVLSDVDRGWQAVIRSKTRPPWKSCIYKVAHHGSANGDMPAIWQNMLTNNPIAVLTPWNLGDDELPIDIDVIRICGRTKHAYITAKPRWMKKPVNQKPTMNNKSHMPGVRLLPKVFGHIRIRFDMLSAHSLPEIDLFGDAISLSGKK